MSILVVTNQGLWEWPFGVGLLCEALEVALNSGMALPSPLMECCPVTTYEGDNVPEMGQVSKALPLGKRNRTLGKITVAG